MADTDPRVEAAYMPTTDQVRCNMAFGVACATWADHTQDAALIAALTDIEWPIPGLRDGCKAEFDAWLAAHDREIAARALREAATELYADETAERGTTKAMRHAVYAAWLLDRADRIEAGEVGDRA